MIGGRLPGRPPSVFTAACAQFATPFHLYDERGIRGTARRLNAAAAERGVLMEPGDPFVAPELAGRFFRLGLSAIDWQLIEPGIAEIAKAAATVQHMLVRG